MLVVVAAAAVGESLDVVAVVVSNDKLSEEVGTVDEWLPVDAAAAVTDASTGRPTVYRSNQRVGDAAPLRASARHNLSQPDGEQPIELEPSRPVQLQS